MCKACQTLPVAVPNKWRRQSQNNPDIRRACREGQKDVPYWLAPKASTKAELTKQLRRLAFNQMWESESSEEEIV